jgi:selenocysteine-specific elongation factor
VHIIGTAGHVDHGKSSLVRALTGTDPDRWLEERLRGMTLDLGFAHLRFDDGLEAGIIDVPGHERFLHSMLAGAAGMELLLLVVAANDGPRPQTLEHLAVLGYLNVRKTIVVLSKVDTVGPDDRDFAAELVRDGTRGTLAETAEIVPVSTLTGEGLDHLRAAIHDALRELPARSPDAPPYLPIDRVFAMPGHGTIVTGTLMQGEISIGDRLHLTPLERDVRVRSLQVFGQARERAGGGSRVAANLVGVDTDEIRRGAVLASEQFTSLSNLEVRFRPLAGALPMLRRRTPVRAYLGAAEILGTLVFEAAPTSLAESAARLHLRTPVATFPGSAYVVRRLSPKDVLGGGIVAGAASSAAAAEESAEAAAVRRALHDAGLEGTTAARAGAAANLRWERTAELLEQLCEDGRALRLGRPAAFVASELVDALYARVREQLLANEARAPWTIGATALELSRSLAVPELSLLRVLNVLAEEGRLAHRAGHYATPEFVPHVSAEQRAFFESALPLDAERRFIPVAFVEVNEKVKAAKIPGLAQSLDTLLASGVLTKVGSDVYRSEQIEAIRASLEEALRREARITAADFRTLLGTSRKYAVALLEWFDSTGVTRRDGDAHVLRKAPLRERASDR